MDPAPPPPVPADGHKNVHTDVAGAVWRLLVPTQPPGMYARHAKDAQEALFAACAQLPARKLERLAELARLASASDCMWFAAQLPAVDPKVYSAALQARAVTLSAEKSPDVSTRPGSTAVYERLDLD